MLSSEELTDMYPFFLLPAIFNLFIYLFYFFLLFIYFRTHLVVTHSDIKSPPPGGEERKLV